MSTEIRLKGGQRTADRRLDAVKQFDRKSRKFAVRETLTDKQRALRSYGWDCYARLNQAKEGACVGFAWAHELASAPAQVDGVTKKIARDLYEDARKVDEWPGERYDGTSVLAGAKVVKARGFMQEYRWAFGVIDALRAVGHFGPIVVGIPWYESMQHPRPSGLLEVTKDRKGGRHAILVTGVALKARLDGEPGQLSVVRLHNSWGRDWGANGDCFLLIDDFEALLRSEGECCVPLGRNRTPDRTFLALTADARRPRKRSKPRR